MSNQTIAGIVPIVILFAILPGMLSGMMASAAAYQSGAGKQWYGLALASILVLLTAWLGTTFIVLMLVSNNGATP